MGRKITIAMMGVSLAIHMGFAMGLMAAADKRAAKRATIAVVTEKKKEKAPEKKPPPPKPIARPAAPKPVAVAKAAAPAAPVRTGPAPVATSIKMSNDDLDTSPGGIGILSKSAVAAAQAAKVASVGQEPRGRKNKELRPGGPEEPCTEEPSKPEPVFKTEIEYTASARAEGIEGKLKLKLTVGANGSVINVEVLASVSPELDAAAVAAAKQWRFKPSTACGKPVAGGTYILARKFELGD